MEDFEERALCSMPQRLKVYYRYVDNTLVIWPHGHQALDQFLEHLNSIHPNIKFAMELEKLTSQCSDNRNLQNNLSKKIQTSLFHKTHETCMNLKNHGTLWKTNIKTNKPDEVSRPLYHDKPPNGGQHLWLSKIPFHILGKYNLPCSHQPLLT
ncbi:hypothetical protein J437_LFUL012895 [Ladona fulva]|uniref:Reverse transcriptase n=1 Tax=Ladona fulva TaxID=123851 RepID=A0A8K0KF57_LADFU|nr:hypothetical protein J437_LFUL012895 [Ladona fulva]